MKDSDIEKLVQEQLRGKLIEAEAKKLVKSMKKEILEHLMVESRKKPFLDKIKKLAMAELEEYLEDQFILDCLTNAEIDAIHRKALLSVFLK